MFSDIPPNLDRRTIFNKILHFPLLYSAMPLLANFPKSVFADDQRASVNSNNFFKTLPKVKLDVTATTAKKKIVLVDGQKLYDFKDGCRIIVPNGAIIPIKLWHWKPKKYKQSTGKVGLSFESENPKLEKPKFVSFEESGIFNFPQNYEIESHIRIKDIDFQGGQKSHSLRFFGTTFVELTNLAVVGGKNCLFISSGPTTANIKNCEFTRGGTGTGLTHCVYINYIKKVYIDQCLFHAAKRQGHALKTYAATSTILNSTIASWVEQSDFDAGFSGELPPLDLGAWSNSLIKGNTIIRRPPTRQVCIDYRNRQWQKGVSKYTPKNWGTWIPDTNLVDNTDISNPYLFHHFLLGNSFKNGILPTGNLASEIARKPGFAIRNNGTYPTESGGSLDKSWVEPPNGWKDKYQRSIVWRANNKVEGIPFDDFVLENDFETPVREFSNQTFSSLEKLLNELNQI